MNCYNINSFLQKWEVLYISKKEPKTYNHYVPQFYLKNFSGIIALEYIILREINSLMKLQ